MITILLKYHTNYDPPCYYGSHYLGGGVSYMPASLVITQIGFCPERIRVDAENEQEYRLGNCKISEIK